MTAETDLPKIADNQEKAKNYRFNMMRFQKAKKEGFYLEATWILYAMLEDRLSSLLYHLGVTAEDDRSEVTHSKAIRRQLRVIFEMKENEKYRLNEFSAKIKWLQKILSWAVSADGPFDRYSKSLRKKILSLPDQRKSLSETLDFLDNHWRLLRNQLMHALMMKNFEGAYSALKELCEDGYSAFRSLDNAVDKIQKGEQLRKCFRIR